MKSHLSLLVVGILVSISGIAFAQTPTPTTDLDAAESGQAAQAEAAAPAPDLESNPASTRPDIDPGRPTIFIAGDSTAARGSGAAQQGWAEPFKAYFDPERVNVVNRARGGRSSRTFITEGLWDQLLADVKAGDIVLIQFGHNDGGPINDDRRARGSLRGLGEESEEIDNLITKKHEVVRTYGWYLRRMIADTKSKGATPIVLSLTIRNIWKEGRVERGSGRYAEWSEAVARAAGVRFVDVTTLVADVFDRMGQPAVAELYERDHTHFTVAGADLHARAVVRGLRQFKDDTIDELLSAAGQTVLPQQEEERLEGRRPPRVGPIHEGFTPAIPTLWLIGDSTVKNGWDNGDDGLWGWGNPVGAFFDRTRLNVENQALGGTSSRSYLTLGLWESVRTQIQPGDFVIMQFGHNDGGPAFDDRRARQTLEGNGEETLDVVLKANGLEETVHTYGWYVQQYVRDIKARGATPIVCSLVPRNDWTDGRVNRAEGSYGRWAREAAEASGAFFVDLNAIVANHYDALGEEAVKPFFPLEHTHTGWEGAVVNAECVVRGIRLLEGCDLRKYLLENPATPKEP